MRYDYIDILKGFTIIWVLYMHMDLPELLYPSVQMPIFFFISGTFYRAKKPTLWQQVKSDSYLYLLPTVCFMAITAVLMTMRGGGNLWSWNIIDVIQKLRNNSITWFLLALFCFRMFNYPFERLKQKECLLLVTALVYPVGFLWKIKFPQIVVPIIPIQEMFMFGIYYALGYCVGKPILEHSGKAALLNPVIWICIGYITLAHLVDWKSGYLKNIPWLVYSFPYTIACIYLGLVLSRIIEKCKFATRLLTYVGKNSIVFYLTHWPLWIFLFKQLSWNPYIVFALITVLEFPLIYLTNNYCPWLIGKHKK